MCLDDHDNNQREDLEKKLRDSISKFNQGTELTLNIF